MEQHPIPQNVTSFEFHLVGDMTLKQFAYFASGLAIAYLLFITLATPLPLMAWPLIVLSAGIGSAFAFLPIMERPLDHWLMAFLKATLSPTQFEFQSKDTKRDDRFFSNRLLIYLQENPQASPQTPVRNLAFTVLATTPAPYPQTPLPAVKPKPLMSEPIPPEPPQNIQTSSPEVESLPSKEELKQTVELAKQAQSIQSKIMETEGQLNQIKAIAAQPGADPKYYTDQFQTILSELQNLNKEASSVSLELAKLAQTPSQIASSVNKPVKPSIIPTLSLTAIPNIINGIVTDAQGSYVEGAIVVAHDKQGLPVRALKSNKLGQFIAATPLPSGSYIVMVEKDSLLFDTVQIDLKDTVLPPMVMAAKKPERVIA